MKLWPHQRAALEAVRASVQAGEQSGLVSMPTGSGKTALFSTAARDLGLRTLVLVHRDELVTQTIKTLEGAWASAKVGVIKAERDEWQDDQNVVIASVQSLHNGRLAGMPRDRYELIVADECHHAAAPTWRAVIEHFEHRYLLGASATPYRTDGQGLADMFGPRPLYTYPLRSAIDDGVLCRLRQYAVETGCGVDGVAVRAGDFANAALSNAVNTPARNGVVVEAFQEYASKRRAVAFTVDVAHAEALAKAFNDAGITSAMVSGATPIDDRRKLLARFRKGKIRVLANCQVLTEGYDDPSVDAILMARPTQSRSLYTQAIGRGLRRFDSKTDCLVLDFVDNCEKHKLVNVLDLFGETNLRNTAGGDVVEAVDRDLAEKERRREIQTLNPLEWRLKRVCPWPALPKLKGYVATAPWHGEPATQKQVEFLNGMGMKLSRSLTKGEASFLIDRAQAYRAEFPEPASRAQKLYLQRCRKWRHGMTRSEAHRLIGEIKGRRRAGLRGLRTQ